MTEGFRHVFDLTDFCTRCGQARATLLDSRAPCIASTNVVAISHVLAGRRMEDLADAVLRSLLRDDR